MTTAFDCVYLSWCSSYWDKELYNLVKFPPNLADDRVFILLNPDKSLRALGTEAERIYLDSRACKGHSDSYFFKGIESLFDPEQVSVRKI